MRASGVRWVCVLALTLLPMPACSGPDAGGSRRKGRAGEDHVGGAVVSTVNGRAIQLGQVQTLAYQSGMPRLESLRKLQAEQLLIDEANHRGSFDRRPEVRDVAQRAAVQALLDAEASEVEVSEDELREEYGKQRERFETKQQRRAMHLLAGVKGGLSPAQDVKAKAIVEAAIDELRTATDLDAFREKHIGQVVDGISIAVEMLPAFAQEGRLMESFETAMFSLEAPGVVPQPVRTQYGWHAIRVLEIIPAKVVPYQTAIATLRDEMRLARQTTRVTELIEALRSRQRVVVSPNASALLAELPP